MACNQTHDRNAASCSNVLCCAYHWLNLVDEDDWWWWGCLNEKPEDYTIDKTIDTSNDLIETRSEAPVVWMNKPWTWLPTLCHYWEQHTREWAGLSLPEESSEQIKSIHRRNTWYRIIGCIESPYMDHLLCHTQSQGGGRHSWCYYLLPRSPRVSFYVDLRLEAVYFEKMV